MNGHRPWALAAWLLTWLLPAAAALLFVHLFAHLTVQVDAFQWRLSARLGWGTTELALPPFGVVRAVTHHTPLALRATLESIDPQRLGQLVAAARPASLVELLSADLRAILFRFTVWTAVVGAAGGAFGAFLVRREVFAVLRGGGVGLVAAAALMALTYATFDATAFHQPTYTGALRAAPWAIALAQEGLAKARRLGEQMAVVATNLSELFERIERIEPAGVAGADATVLVVSDIHNNPVAMDLVDNVVATFRPSFVLDAGDLTDYGTAFEARGVIRLGSLGLPYAFAPGNHDFPTLLAQLRRLPNVVAFETPRVVTLADVPVLGGPDPSSRRPTPALPTDEELQAQVAGMAEAMAHAHIPPVIAVAHNPQVARAFVGTVPVVVTGHTHRLDVHQEAGTVWINPGTTGAAGLRGLQAPEEVPYTLVLLYLDRTDDGWRVLATDLISLRNVQGTMVLERRAFGVAQPEEGSEGGSGLHRSAG